jgi:phage terminase small subunit
MPRASASAAATANLLVKAKPPAPPRHMNQEAQEHWKRIVAARPIDFFSAGNLPLLEQYCRTLVFLRQASDLLDTIDAADVGHFAEQTAVVSRLTTMAIVLATKLRLTVQSTVRGDASILRGKPASRSPLLGGNVTTLRRN